jgi:predicted glycoside hydrolase/deacetylase ChbG (UPF0249 family)
MSVARVLIVNADDFGLSLGVNRGIIRAFEDGIVTSASLMVRWPAAALAARYAREHPRLGLGLHLDLGEWAFADGDWVALYEVVHRGDAVQVRSEVGRQLAAFRDLVGRDPDHLDSHQHVHRSEPAASALAEAADVLGVPLRHATPGVRYCGEFYGQTADGAPLARAISLEHLAAILAGLGPGVTELGCHPGIDDALATMYRMERAEEVRVLCDPCVRAAVAAEGIELLTFRDVTPTGIRVGRPGCRATSLPRSRRPAAT